MNALAPLTALDPVARAVTIHRPTLLRAALLRFGFCYWTLFCLSVTDQVTGITWFGELYRGAWNPLVLWVGKHVLGISYEIYTGISGSGDKTIDWVSLVCIVTISAVTTIAWLAIDRRRAHDARIREFLRIGIRYMLGFILLEYGVSKVLLLQFPAPDSGRLMLHYGDSSPMGLLWTLMGASPVYQFFSGAAEVVGGLLVLFRRTTTLGAMVLAAVLTNIVMLNLCYDVPVKINSSHYLAMCVLLILPELRRFASILWLNRATQPVPHDLVLSRRWMRITRRVVKASIIVLILAANVHRHAKWITRDRDRGWYDGYWAVTRFTRDGQDLPALITDKTRWLRVRFDTWPDQVLCRWRFMDDSRGDLYKVTVDEHAQTLHLEASAIAGPLDHLVPPVSLHYTRTGTDHLQLDGRVGGASISVQLERWESGPMLLMSRGFHWINETSFNR